MAGQDIASQASVLVKDASKRKRVNRKLKQCKLDARREQWLSQVTMIKHGKDGRQESSSSGKLDLGEIVHSESHDNLAYGSRDIQRYASEKFDKALSHSHLHLLPSEHCGEEDLKDNLSPSASCSRLSDCFETEVSPKSTGSCSPKSKVKKVETLHGQESRERFSHEMKSKEGIAGHIRCISEHHAVPEKTDDHGHDSESEDWEAVADALGVNVSCEGVGHSNAREGKEKKVSLDLSQASLTDCTIQRTVASREVFSRSFSLKAWRPDDTHRPASLPNLSKQQSLPAYFPENNQPWVGAQKALQDLLSGPSLCPICAEELDTTDFSFEPCACGFQLCLFCHHRIASEDGRCPGCRRFYSSSSTASLAPSLKC
ncbi:hypothetical protein L7F22_003589 [Adiantum nelumboides]|nr:hypothetical protein [Adiantum nelumboides]